ncbi:omptin family outer membrane protease [candidate division TA06 bacterium]|uniref:Omptin family outer membrane protease n=1 Tax=candidate division TA06 bacterium TaxID=2250710 RepID=A0A933IAP7_UNCT6|nr:omptin family outer membrane protease [candidate division TA06 bacterium]
MKKVLTIGFMFLIIFLISSSGYSQDTTAVTSADSIPENASAGPTTTPQKSFSWGEKIDLSLSLQGKKVSGYTEYHIKFPTSVWHWEDTTWVEHTVNGQSVLAFPVDGYRIEALVNSRLKLSKKLTFIFGLGFSTIISQPNDAMVDSDYVDLSSLGSFSNWVNGATQSSVSYSNYEFLITAGYPLFSGKPWEVIPIVGYQTSKNRFDVMGLAGWYNVYGYRETVDSLYYAGMNVSDYEVTYNRIMTGAQVKTKDAAKVGFSLKAFYSPWVKASDYDNHLLRFKESSTEAKGKGYSLEGTIKVSVYTTRAGSILSVGGGYSMLRIKATGSQIQKWYGDDPATDGFDDTGSVSSPIDNTLKLRQNSFNAFIEYKL